MKAMVDAAAATVQAAPADYATSTAFTSTAKPTGALNVTADAATVTAATAAVAGEAGNALGTTYVLTKGLDALTGTAANDVIIASTDGTAGSELFTMNSLDSIDGSAGIDTLKISSSVANLDEADLPSLSNVEVIEIAATAILGNSVGPDTFDVSAIDGLTLLKVTRATDAYLEAADTTNVTVSGATGTIEIDGGNTISVSDTSAGDKDITIGAVTAAAGAITVTDTKQGSGVIAVDGGTNVSVTATATDAGLTTTGAIDIGQAADLPTGTITVVQNLEFDGDDAGTAGVPTDLTGGNITITGGTVVNVTVNANNVATVDTAADDIVIGTIAITGDDNTTSVTVTQNDNSEIFSSEDVGGVTETSTVTFGELKSGDSLEVAGLIFTASKDLTGAQVAEAFAGLTATDKQDAGGIVENGIYTGVVNGNWTSAAASGATVVFTSVTANTNVANLSTVVTLTNTSTNSVAPTYVEVPGAPLTTTGADSSNAVVFGVVTIADGGDDSITTVTVDGYATASTLASDVLETLTLKNSATNAVFTVTNTTADSALALNVDNITTAGAAEIDLDGTAGTITDLTINATAAASEFILTASGVTDLTINAAVALTLTATTDINASESIDVNGAGAVNLGNISGATALNSFDASGNTGGVTATIETDAADLNGDIEEYVFSEGADIVTLQDATVDVKVTTGAGNDKVTLTSGTTSLAAVIDGGAGTNTLSMVAADAVTASGSTTFETKITNFQKLSLASTSAAGTVDLANMDDISYVISANSTGGAIAEVQTFTVSTGTSAAVAEQQTIDFLNTTVATAGTYTVGGITVALTLVDNGISIATKVAAAINGQILTAPATTTTAVTATANNGVVTITYPATADFGAVTLDETADTLVLAGTAPVITNDAVAYDSNAGNITVNGGTVGLTAGLTVDQVGAAIAAAQAAIKAADANVDTVTYTAATDTVTITYLSASGNVGTGVITNTSATGATFSAVSTTTIGSATGGDPLLTLDNMANNGTLELTTAGAGVIVTMTDATGDADTFNIIVSDSLTAAGINVGSVTVDDVETVNVTANDTFTDDGVLGGTADDSLDDVNAAHTLNVDGDAVETIDVGGAGDLTLTTTSTVLETVNGSDMTGKLTFIAALADLVVTSGSGADVLTVSADDVEINAGTGNDTIIISAGADRADIDGGAGRDTFIINGASATSSTYAIIASVASGDTIKFTGASVFKAAEIELSAGATETTQALMDLAVNNLAVGEMGWFQTGGNTFIVMDAGANSTEGFVDSQDMVVMITGRVDLSTASFNATSHTLEIA